DSKEKLVGGLAVILCGGGAIALSFGIALRTFWWCPQGGCSLAPLTAKLHLLANVVGVIALMAVISLLLLFPFAALARLFVARPTMERVVVSGGLPGLRWYDKLQLKWVALLYRGAAT